MVYILKHYGITMFYGITVSKMIVVSWYSLKQVIIQYPSTSVTFNTMVFLECHVKTWYITHMKIKEE